MTGCLKFLGFLVIAAVALFLILAFYVGRNQAPHAADDNSSIAASSRPSSRDSAGPLKPRASGAEEARDRTALESRREPDAKSLLERILADRSRVSINLASGEKRCRVARADFGDLWPLTVDSGIVVARAGAGKYEVITFETSDATYALNGIAVGRAKRSGWRAIEEIWRIDPRYRDLDPPLRVDISVLIDLGLALAKVE